MRVRAVTRQLYNLAVRLRVSEGLMRSICLADGVIVWHVLGEERHKQLFGQVETTFKHLQHDIQDPVGVKVEAA